MNAQSTIVADPATLDLAWHKSAGATAALRIMLDVASASTTIGDSPVDEASRSIRSTFGQLLCRRERIHHNSFSTEQRVSANGGIVGELWLALELLRSQHLEALCGGHLYTQAQFAQYRAIGDAAPTVEEVVTEALRDAAEVA